MSNVSSTSIGTDFRLGENSLLANSKLANARYLTSINGQSATIVQSPVPLFDTDALEEIGIARLGSGDRSLESRKPKRSNEVTDAGVDLAREYIDAVSGSSAVHDDELEHSIRAMERSLPANISESEIEDDLDSILSRYGRSSRHVGFASLVALNDRLDVENNGNKSLKTLLATSIENRFSAHGIEIRAGFNIASIAQSHEQIDSESGLLALYMDVVLESSSLADIHTGVLDRYTSAQYADTLQFLIGAAGSDITSMVSSSDINLLRDTVSSLRNLQILRTIEDKCDKLSVSLRECLISGAGARELYSVVLKTIDLSWPLPETIMSSYQAVTINEPQFAVWIHTELNKVVESIPHEVFKDDRSRENLVTAMKEALDIVVDIEEQESDDEPCMESTHS